MEIQKISFSKYLFWFLIGSSDDSKSKDDQEEWGEFLHIPGQKFYDFDKQIKTERYFVNDDWGKIIIGAPKDNIIEFPSNENARPRPSEIEKSYGLVYEIIAFDRDLTNRACGNNLNFTIKIVTRCVSVSTLTTRVHI